MKDRIKILVVEDDTIAMRFIETQIENLGHNMVHAKNGQEAIDTLNAGQDIFDVIIMDREMPVMDGLRAIRIIKDSANHKDIPIIMVTGADGMAEMNEGLAAGVFYYLTKPVQPEILKTVLSAAIRQARQSQTLTSELGRHRTGFNLIDTCKFKFTTLAEAEDLSAFVANCFPEPRRVVQGIGELFINAIEHGNLGIGYEKKGELLESQIWRAEVERLQANIDRQVEAVVTRKDKGIYLIVTDMGQGFDWRQYMTIDPSRAGDQNGRGIAQANAVSFDHLTYNDVGNQAIALVNSKGNLQW